MTGAQLIVQSLKKEKVDTLFAYPGGQVIDIFDVLYDETDINVIVPRHEQALGHAADGYARSTGKTGVCLVTSGPGATNLVTAIANASCDSVPMVCFTGQVSTSLLGKDAFQEADIVSCVKMFCKYCVTVKKREDLADIISNAFCIAQSGRPGVCLIDIPKDIQQAELDDEYMPKKPEINRKAPENQIKKAADAVSKAEKPLIIFGGGIKISGAQKQAAELVRISKIPFVTTIMGKGCVPTDAPLYLGNVGIHGNTAANKAINECDLLIGAGTRFNDRVTGKAQGFAPNAKLIHIDISDNMVSKNIPAQIPIICDAKAAIKELSRQIEPADYRKWTAYLLDLKDKHPIVQNNPGLTPKKIIEQINLMLDNSVIIADVGQNQMWTTQFIELDEGRQFFTSGGLGTMGYALPAAIGAKIGNPDKRVVCISGDGGIQMNIQELATAVYYRLNIIICVFNNQCLGNVRQWQEMFYDKRYSYTCFYENSDYSLSFCALAEKWGLTGIKVENKNEIKPAFEKALSITNGPVLIEFMINSDINILPIIPPGETVK
ncbi:MAG: biosynthetic-type acetolactate synthase large subunit [Eubacterium sp.]